MLASSYPSLTHLAIWRLEIEQDMPQSWYWPVLKAWKGLKTDDLSSSSSYELYRPAIEYSTIVSPLTSPLQYNHDSSIALFKSVWIAVWNANTSPDE